MKGSGRGRKGGLTDFQQGFSDRQAQLQKLAARLQASSAPARQHALLERRSLPSPNDVSFAERRNPDKWLRPEAGRSLLRSIMDAVSDGADRAVLGWPEAPGSAFVAMSIAMREARATGELAHAAFAYWPWRAGATAAAKQILVDPQSLAKAARDLVTAIRTNNAPWARPDLGHEAMAIVEMSLAALGKAETLRSTDVSVRRPTLLETTTVFPPHSQSRDTYGSVATHFLYRVQKYTWLRKAIANSDNLLSQIERPLTSPFAIFGLPNTTKSDQIERCLRDERLKRDGLDVVVVDLTRTSRAALLEDWEKGFVALLRGLLAANSRRPPVVAICDDAHTFTRASRLIRMHNAGMKPARPNPKQVGVLLTSPGLLGPSTSVPDNLPAVKFKADIKDAELGPLRADLVSLGHAMRAEGNQLAARGAFQALNFLKRIASLPVGLDEASAVARQIYDSNDDADARLRALFMPKMELNGLAAIAESSSAHASSAARLVDRIQDKVDNWRKDTPVSMKLATLLDSYEGQAEGVVLAVPHRRIAEVFLASDRALRWACSVRDRDGLESTLSSNSPRGLIVVGPTPEVIRTILLSPNLPPQVEILGDVAGISLVLSELRPAENLEAFASLRPRAIALRTEISRHGGDESLDLKEAEFSVSTARTEGVVDLTRSGGNYTGEKIRIETSDGVYLYRPNSEVLVHSVSETRAFEKVEAARVEVGMEILAMNQEIRDSIRQALAGSRKVLDQINVYHSAIRGIRERTPGASPRTKAYAIVIKMMEIDPATPLDEVNNVQRWLQADLAPQGPDGGRQPGAARDFPRFKTFCQAVQIDHGLIEVYWRAAILPTRSFRVQEAFDFNRRVVNFVLDPESAVLAARATSALPALSKQVEQAIEEVVSVKVDRAGDRIDA